MSIRSRKVLDVAELPDVVFGPRDIMWWGTVGFMVIEGFTLVLCAAVFIYLQQNYAAWPPPGTPLPDLIVPTIHVAAMLASLPLMSWISRSAHAFDLRKVQIGLTVATLVCATFVALRLVETLVSVHVKWNTNAYGSAQWLILGAHFTLLLVQLVEVAGMAGVFWLAPIERKHFSDAADVAFYWYFMVLVWLPLYVICFLLPRWI